MVVRFDVVVTSRAVFHRPQLHVSLQDVSASYQKQVCRYRSLARLPYRRGVGEKAEGVDVGGGHDARPLLRRGPRAADISGGHTMGR